MKRILLIGVGRWGANHLRVLKSMPIELYVADCHDQRLSSADPVVQILPRLARRALDEIATNPIRNRRIE
jgi:hypothetical protein